MSNKPAVQNGEKRNIAFVTSDLKSGGSERVASRLTFLFGERYKIYYIVFNSEDISYDVNAELIDLNVPPSDSIVKKVINTFKRARGIRRAVKKHNIDTVMAFTSIANRAMRFSRAKCRMIGACRGFEDLMLHPAEYHQTIAAGARMLFNSREAQEYYLNIYPGDADKCLTIENLLDVAKIEELSKAGLPPEHAEFYATHKVVSTVGSFSRHKGHWDLFKSFELLKERVPDAGLVVVGHRGLIEDQLRDMAARNKYADDVLLAGFQRNPFPYVAKSDAYALSSISEGFPNALEEAMVCGVPCVSTACMTGPCEIAWNEYRRTVPEDDYIIADNCILAPVFDGVIDYDYSHKTKAHEVYARALERLLTDRGTADKLAAAGKARAALNDEKVIADQYFELIEDGRDK